MKALMGHCMSPALSLTRARACDGVTRDLPMSRRLQRPCLSNDVDDNGVLASGLERKSGLKRCKMEMKVGELRSRPY